MESSEEKTKGRLDSELPPKSWTRNLVLGGSSFFEVTSFSCIPQVSDGYLPSHRVAQACAVGRGEVDENEQYKQ